MLINTIIIFAVFFGVVFMYYDFYTETKKLAQYMEYKTVFYNKENPSIKCVIENINWNDLINPRITLKVMYSSGHQMMLQTTSNDFMNIWVKCEDS